MPAASTLPRVKALDEEPELTTTKICQCECKCRIRHLRGDICALCERGDHWVSLTSYLDKVAKRRTLPPGLDWTHSLDPSKLTKQNRKPRRRNP